MVELKVTDDCSVLVLSGGLGARVIQTCFIKNLRDRHEDMPVVVIDDMGVGALASASDPEKIFTTGISEGGVPGFQHPLEPPLQMVGNVLEHPIFVDSWRESVGNFASSGFDVPALLARNWDRVYGIDYGLKLVALIHRHKLVDEERSFIGHLYGQVIHGDSLEYLGNKPQITRNEFYADVADFAGKMGKPLVLVQMGMDRGHGDYTRGINYRTHKVWSSQRWSDLVGRLSRDYVVAQVYTGEVNPRLPNCFDIRVNSLGETLQLLEYCKFFVSVDSSLAHIAASMGVRGVVLWGSVSPYVWGWPHNENVWNKESCETIACWRPNQFDVSPSGQTFLCNHYSCMRSITVDQVMKRIEKLVGDIDDADTGTAGGESSGPKVFRAGDKI